MNALTRIQRVRIFSEMGYVSFRVASHSPSPISPLNRRRTSTQRTRQVFRSRLRPTRAMHTNGPSAGRPQCVRVVVRPGRARPPIGVLCSRSATTPSPPPPSAVPGNIHARWRIPPLAVGRPQPTRLRGHLCRVPHKGAYSKFPAQHNVAP